MVIIGCSHGIHLAKKIALSAKKPYAALAVEKFPDSETHLSFPVSVRGKEVVLVQSFYGCVNDCLVEVFFAAMTAKELGAKKVALVAPYFPYLRQDDRFYSGECVSLEVIARYVDQSFDAIAIMDPHLHREKSLKHIFRIPSSLSTANPLIAAYIKKYIRNAVIFGPDFESYRWAEATAKLIGCESATLRKTRYSSRKVKVALNKKIDLGRSHVVIVDDIISTGHTILETIKLLKGLGAKAITCICVHGIFAEGALGKLQKAGATVVACNTIPNPVAKIDVSTLLASALK
ncbi:ribose-phosphate diphosphokinase [Candidatus Woesearchaeota archaeon]|nr:ribose-phosphate diphosphokinase [Candidatus Woesearchaeota archaeon]